MRPGKTTVVAMMISTGLLAAQQPRLVKDINERLVATPSYPKPGAWSDAWSNERLTQVLNVVYFVAQAPATGMELYQTLGTAATTRLVGDLLPGPAGSQPAGLTSVGLRLFFTARDPRYGRELWVAEPLRKRVYLVANINKTPVNGSGVGDSNPTNMLEFGSIVLFRAEDQQGNHELWKSDGTATGTVMVKEIAPSRTVGSDPRNLIVFAGEAYFQAREGAHYHLWKTDGTTAGTVRVAAVRIADKLTPMVEFGGFLYFGGSTSQHGAELWRTDGTAQGTQLVHDVYPGWEDGQPADLTVMAGALYFSAEGIDPNRRSVGRELFKTDGASLTLFDVHAGAPGSQPALFEVHGKGAQAELYFSATGTVPGQPTQATGRELWHIGASGQLRVLDLWPGDVGAQPFSLASGPGGASYFAAAAPAGGFELHRTDGTLAGTRVVKQINTYADPNGSNPAYLTPTLNGDLLLVADDGPHGRELWRTDGTAAGTTLLGDLNPTFQHTRDARPAPKAVVGNWLYFAARPDDGRQGLWMTDGTAANTMPVPGLKKHALSWVGEVLVVGDKVFVVGSGRDRTGAETGVELWALDNRAGTTQLIDVMVGPGSSHPGGLTWFDGALYFAAVGTRGLARNPGRELWRTDGTAAGTRLVADIDPAHSSGYPNSSNPGSFTVFGGRLYLVASNDAYGEELWSTDGTTAGTRLAVDVFPGVEQSHLHALTVLGSRLVFVAVGPQVGAELWVSDGTQKGTRAIDLAQGPASGFVDVMMGRRHVLTRVGDRLYFAADGDHNGAPRGAGQELWSTDGTARGTALVADLNPLGDGKPGAITPIGHDGDFVFVADRGVARTSAPAIYVSDGSRQGTRFVVPVDRGWQVDDPELGRRFGSRHALFRVPVHGRYGPIGYQLVMSDGTASGTRIVADRLALTSFTSTGWDLTTPVNGRLFMVRDVQETGSELWVLEGHALATPVGVGCGPGNSPAPRLRADDPVDAGNTGVTRPRVDGAARQAIGVLMVGQWLPAPPVLWADCRVHVGLPGPKVFLPFATDAWGRWQGVLSTRGVVPGFRYAMQAAVEPTNTRGVFGLSNAVVLTTGK